jgi:hypothetical protein
VVDLPTSPESWSAAGAIAAALAAFAAVVTAIFSYRAQVRSLRDSVRPDLVLSDWSLRPDSERGWIRVGRIENVGNGPARHVSLTLSKPGEAEAAVMSTSYKAALPAGDSYAPPYEGVFYWEYGLTGGDEEVITLDLDVVFSDTHGNRYTITHHLITHKPGVIFGDGIEKLCDNLYLTRSDPKVQSSQSVRRREFARRQLGRLKKPLASVRQKLGGPER